MPRPQKTTVDAGSGAQVFDAFALAQEQVPRALSPVPVEPAEGQGAAAKAAETTPKRKSKARAKAKPAAEKPEVRRMGRRKTGRSIQFNQSVTAETANGFYDMQAQLEIPMGAVLERAIKALQEKLAKEDGKGATD